MGTTISQQHMMIDDNNINVREHVSSDDITFLYIECGKGSLTLSGSRENLQAALDKILTTLNDL